MNDQLIKQLIIEEFSHLQQSVNTLLLSVEKCENIGKKENYSFEEMESFDSLTSKFNRTSDLYTQKVLRTIWALLHEPFVPFIDLLNKSERLQIIDEAESLLAIRDLRNQIAHEYIPEAITGLIPEVIGYCQALINNIDKTRAFIRNRNWIE